jgi:hypothetical protein
VILIFENTLMLNGGFLIPSCTTPNYILTNNGSGHFTCVDPNTIISGGNGGSAVGANYAISLIIMEVLLLIQALDLKMVL